MNRKLGSPFSEGQGGAHFEAHIQAWFVILMVTGGKVPCLPSGTITKIKLQGKAEEYQTDDLIVFVEQDGTNEESRFLAQIKYSVNFKKSDLALSKAIQYAWNNFNHPKNFTPDRDTIVLITSPLNATDNNVIPWLLNQARYTKDANEFYRRIKLPNFSPPESDKKLDIIEYYVSQISDKEILKEELYRFLKHLQLIICDLGGEDGIFLSWILSHISQFIQDKKNTKNIWSRFVDMVQTWNQNAGTITPDNIPKDLKEYFKPRTITSIPDELSPVPNKAGKNDIVLSQCPYPGELALANLIGAWDTSNQKDIDILSSFLSQVNQEYNTWILRIEEILPQLDSFISLNGEQWEIKNRGDLWKKIGSRIHDKHLNALKDIAVKVFTERDPYFGSHFMKRHIDIVRNREITTISSDLRRGLVNSLAFLGSQPEALSHCSQNNVENTVNFCVHQIFSEVNIKDAVLWGSLNELLPLLAEAAPERFLYAVEAALRVIPSPFDNLFSQEGNFITGRNYMTGLLSALESLAWDPQYLVQVCIILGKLASRDPGGTWANRPADSLTTILLPSCPQTIASAEKRQVAIRTLSEKESEIAWKLIISLLPECHRIIRHSRRPLWRKLPKVVTKKITQEEYQEQVSSYFSSAISIAKHSTEKILELTQHLDTLPESTSEKLLKVLVSDEILALPEDRQSPIWERLKELSLQYRKFPDPKRILLNKKLPSIIKKLEPAIGLLNSRKILFTVNPTRSYEYKGNWEEQDKKLREKQQQAVKEIWETGGVSMVTKFSKLVESPEQVGRALGHFSSSREDTEIDKALFPKYLKSDISQISCFIHGYIIGRHLTQGAQGWSWVDGFNKKDWNNEQIADFFVSLPFTNDTWERVKKWPGEIESSYWKKVNIWWYPDWSCGKLAIDKLINHKRPRAAVVCLYRMLNENSSLDTSQCVKALMSALNSSEHISQDDYQYSAVQIIKKLQESPSNINEICIVEWSYLELLESHDNISPKCLEKRIAKQPELFCKLICSVYRPKDIETEEKMSDQERLIEERAWRLLWRWKYPPGTKEDGSFDSAQFKKWLNAVKKIFEKSGQLESALRHTGEALVYYLKDINNPKINHEVANILNEEDAEIIREGFCTRISNSRGASHVDPTAKSENDLSEKYWQWAEEIEDSGYSNLAVSIKELSKSYKREARFITDEFKNKI